MNSKNESNPATMENTISQLSGFEQWLITKPWRLWATMIVGGVLFVWALNYTALRTISGSFLAPWIIAAGIIISQGVELFSGNIPDTSWGLANMTSLVSIIFFYMAMPALFFTSWRQLKQSDLSSVGKKSFRKAFLTFFISGAFTLSIVVWSWPVAIIQVQVRQNMLERSARSANRDALFADLNQLAFRARVFYFLPTSSGGGGKRWKNIVTPNGTTRDFMLEDLHYSSPMIASVYGDLFPQSPNKFVPEPITNDTVLTIVGIGNKTGDDPKFLNKDGRVGRVQAKLTVFPHSYTIQTEN